MDIMKMHNPLELQRIIALLAMKAAKNIPEG